MHIKEISELYKLGLIEGRIKETRNFIETISKSIDKFSEIISKIENELENQIKNLEERLNKGELSQEDFEKGLKELEDHFNEVLNKIETELDKIDETLTKRLMILRLLEEKLGISGPREKEEDIKKVIENIAKKRTSWIRIPIERNEQFATIYAKRNR